MTTLTRSCVICTMSDSAGTAKCSRCDEPIVVGGSGRFVTHVDATLTATQEPVHAECLALSIIGHTYGLCHCTGYQGLSKRAAALELQRRMRAELSDDER